MTKTSGRVQLGTRLPPDLIKRLKQSAAQNNRTLSAELELAVEQYLDDQDASKLPPELLKAIEDWYKTTPGLR